MLSLKLYGEAMEFAQTSLDISKTLGNWKPPTQSLEFSLFRMSI